MNKKSFDQQHERSGCHQNASPTLSEFVGKPEVITHPDESLAEASTAKLLQLLSQWARMLKPWTTQEDFAR
jgi:hypothetical protein